MKSKVVGNHLYSTSRDWTWTCLIDDGKALLAIDDEQGDRIISTDKKALKVGGLYLALNGIKVKPGDYIDIEKEYELLALDDQEGGEVTGGGGANACFARIKLQSPPPAPPLLASRW